jgi:hypothetical protein
MFQEVLLAALATLAGLLFVAGSLQAFQVPWRLTLPRRKKLRKRRRKPVKAAAVAAVPPPVQAAGNGRSRPPVSMPGPAPAATLATRAVAWPVKAPAAPAATAAAAVDQPAPVKLGRSKIVVHYADGRILKGFIEDFYPNKPSFHLLPATTGFSFTQESVEVRIEELKAVFFVRDFAGNPAYSERKCFLEGERPPGRKVRVVFKDGEVMVGSTVSYERQRQGFFLVPADPQSNNRSVFAVSAFLTSLRFL